jgi:glycosyltransferase involved in cell wall biosynthesis
VREFAQRELRLLLMGTEFFRSRGGIQYVNRALGRALAAFAESTPARVEVFSLNDRAADRDAGVLPPEGFHWRAFDRNRFGLARGAAWRVARLRPHLALLTHAHLLRLVPWLRALSPRTHFAVLGHGIEVWQPLPRSERRGLLECASVLAPSRYTSRQLAEVNGVEPQRMRVLAHGLDFDASQLLPAIRFPSREGVNILTVSRLLAADREKGVELLIRAMPWVLRDVPHARLRIAGDGDDRAWLEQRARSEQVADRVQFLGELDDRELREAYARADVFALPSKKEGFGIVFLEAMAHALPVVALAAGGTTDVVEDGVTGILLPSDSPRELASALSGLLLVPAERARLGAAGRRRLEENFLFSHFARRWHHWLVEAVPEAVYLARHSAAFGEAGRAA